MGITPGALPVLFLEGGPENWPVECMVTSFAIQLNLGSPARTVVDRGHDDYHNFPGPLTCSSISRLLPYSLEVRERQFCREGVA